MTEVARDRRLTVLRFGLPALAGAGLAVAGHAIWSGDAGTSSPVAPATVAGIFWAGQLWYVSYRTAPEEWGGRPRRYWFGLANGLTLLRSGLYSVVAGLAAVSPATATPALAWLPALAYGSGVVLDSLDGTVARTIGRETPLGKRLDMAVDTAGFVAAPVVAVLWGLLPPWYLSLSAARYVFRGVRGWRRLRGKRVYELPAGDLSKYLAGVQMVFLTAVLLPAVPTELGRQLAPVVLAPSLAVFGRDSLAISGLYPPGRKQEG